ncbi:MAG TPA: phosphohydrolase [Lentisphaeria bacterium]|jgi:poly(A) polymerase|nr:phosphohydrolase [Lentisphaeria bacterium]
MSERIHNQIWPASGLTPAEEHAAFIVQTLREHGHEAYVVGGAVRDRLLGRAPNDVDVATGATPKQVQKLFRRNVAVGAAFGVIVVVGEEVQTEVATFRIDGGYVDGRRPEGVTFADAREDAKRRDFTINALFYDPVSHEIVDFIGGLTDLKKGIIRTVGDASRRFEEDYLRMLRAVRFSARFQFPLDSAAESAIQEFSGSITQISAERIFSELDKMLTGAQPAEAFELLDRLGLLEEILPELTCMHGVTQPPEYHPEGDVWVHNMLLLRNMVHPCSALAWGVLLHDVGKPPTFEIGSHGRETFPCHAAVGADMAEDILKRLKASNEHIRQVRELVYYHMSFADVKKMRKATLRRMFGRDTFELELDLHRIDCLACHGILDNYVFCLDELAALANEPPVPEPLLRGGDAMALGIAPGPRIGELLRKAQDLQLDGALTSREQALEWLEEQLR